MKTVAVIPCLGRIELLKWTIRRLYQKNKIDVVICVGHEDAVKDLCKIEHAEFVEHDNSPLGKKWNAGFEAAKKHNPDSVLFVGSSDWISDNWMTYCEKFINAGIDMVGKPDFNLLDIGGNSPHTYRFCHWQGYGKGKRENEPIGIGRVLSRKILDQMNWKPISDSLENSIDFSMYNNILAIGGKVANLKTQEIHSLSISTDRWPNKHKFNDHYSNKLPSRRVPDFSVFLEKNFPEYKLIFKNED